MLISLFYRPQCLKSQFYRIVLREMTWEITEYDVTQRESEEKLLSLKHGLGDGVTAITPAIYTTEVYSHEILPTIEYLHERNPAESMFPDDPTPRLAARTLLHRALRKITPIWDRMLEDGDETGLIAFCDEHERLITEMLLAPNFIRSGSQLMPSYVEILFALIYLKRYGTTPMENKTIKNWLKKLMKRESFQEVMRSSM